MTTKEKLIPILLSNLIVMCSCTMRDFTTSSEWALYNIDSSVNGVQLMNADSFDSLQVHSIENHIVNTFYYGEGVYVSNVFDNEFLFLKLNCGRIGLQFDGLILTDTIEPAFLSDVISSNIQSFKTSLGAYIGMSKVNFIDMYLHKNQLKIAFDSIYIRHDTFTLIYNKFTFIDDTLRKIEITYDE